jgi:ABC-type glycerol-3-phosphate transport system substrate-binding protein
MLNATRSVDGGLYAIQNFTHTCGVYYNHELFAQAGLEPPSQDWTWEDMREAAVRLTEDWDEDGRTDRYGIFIPAHFIEAFEQMNHAPIHRNTIFLEISPEAREVHERYLALIRDGLMPDIRRVQALGMQAAQLLQSGRVAMLVEGVPHPGLVDTLTIDWRLVPLPHFDGLEPRYFRSDSGGISISAVTKHPDAAWKTLIWLISEASAYQPNPIIGNGDFVDAWLKKHPRATDTGFREVWTQSELYPGGDPRYFVRFSSWTMNAILTRLQPLLDQLWAGAIQSGDLADAVPKINKEVRKELERQLRSPSLRPGFRSALQKALHQADASSVDSSPL